jgi:tRNA pseudouridine55 synthase
VTDGLVLIDKPSGITSHTVVARARRALGQRRIGHAGTLDPMATGVLVLGVGRATRLLGHLAADGKQYAATVRLGVATVTDDAEGETTAVADASGLTVEAIAEALAAFRGDIAQVPSAVSAVKVDGRRAYARVRAGEDVVLPARQVRIDRLDLGEVRPGDGVVDCDLVIDCSSGTYIRAIARDLGAALGVGGHLTALRRSRSGVFTVSECVALSQWEAAPTVIELPIAVDRCFPRLDLTAADAERVGHGAALARDGIQTGPIAAFAPDGSVVALMEPRDDRLRPLVVFAG